VPDCRETVRPLFGYFPEIEDTARKTPGMSVADAVFVRIWAG
jgi:hypothetical protein